MGHLDTLFEEVNASAGWDQKHGPDWTFADVPYHLAYCNRDVIARGLELGPDYPEEEQELLADPRAWAPGMRASSPNGRPAKRQPSRWPSGANPCSKFESLGTFGQLFPM